jgi:signal transduction histidine kinase
MSADNPLLSLVGISAALLGLLGILVFAIVKLRKSGRETATGSERLSEEAFAAATIQAALAARPAPAPGVAGRPAAGMPALTAGVPGGDTLDAAVLDALPIGLIATDEAGVIRRCSAAARHWLSIAGAGTGHPFRASLPAWPALADALARVHAGDALPPFVLLAGIEAAPVRVTVSVVRWTPRTGRGGAVAMLSAGPAAAALAPAPLVETGSELAAGIGPRGRADDVARLASGFAHELANSLTTVHGYAHLVDRGRLSDADRSALENICASAERMLATVEAFRSLARPLTLSPGPFAPAEAVRAAIDLARQESGLAEAAIDVAASPSGTVVGDQVLLEEAVAVVIRNALEASAERSPVPPVHVRVGQVLGEPRVDIVITDRGHGVPEDFRGRMFQPFLTDKPGHLGLGLARAVQILRAHPGTTMAFAHPPAGGLVVTIGLPQHG